MKIVWFSNINIANETMSGSGTWVMAMARALCVFDPTIEISNISMSNKDSDVRVHEGRIRQIMIKSNTVNDYLVSRVHDYIKDIKPCLLHVWGTESMWASFPFNTELPVLVDMQGVVSTVYDNFYGGLSASEIRSCWTLKECLKPTSSLQYARHIYKNLMSRESTVIKSLKFVSVQSSWVEGHIRALNPRCKIFHTGIALRPEFYSAEKWSRNDGTSPVIFSTATMSTPLKGLHILLRTLVIIRQYFPTVELRLAGDIQSGIRMGGYAKLLQKFIRHNNLQNNVKFLGALDTNSLIKEYQTASVVINPSSIESYSLVVAEAMHIGSPIVAAFVGGMTELGKNNESILYFPKEDYVTCARRILEILESNTLSTYLSKNAIDCSLHRDSLETIVSKQLNIYNSLLCI